MPTAEARADAAASVVGYDLSPVIVAPDGAERAVRGWPEVLDRFRTVMTTGARPGRLALECYIGVDVDALIRRLTTAFPAAVVIDSRSAFRSSAEIDALVAPWLGGDDPLFGRLSPLDLDAFLDPERVRDLVRRAADPDRATLIVGPGAFRIAAPHAVFIHADLPRWEAQQRQRSNRSARLGGEPEAAATLQYKRAFFVDWRVCDRIKAATLKRWDFVLDTTRDEDPRLVDGQAYRTALDHAVARPFRLVPFFDPGVWGGQWMRRVCGLEDGPSNYAWCFDCVPEENGLLLRFGSVVLETPAINLVLAEAERLLGVPVYDRFGAEFPIRFDLLDTMGGGNLSLQVHPTAAYAREHFGLGYTQDESYYLLDAGPNAQVYLGLKSGIDPAAMLEGLTAAQTTNVPFDDAAFVTRFPARRHDHFLIPAGTVHASGRDAMVLEISATPYIFTFKLWDWGRLGLDGRPRPINIERGAANIAWDRNVDFAERELVNVIEPLASGDGWREERTGLHPSQFIETRRHWFTGRVAHDTGGAATGGVNVLNLVQGDAAIVESPTDAFKPFVVHYAETFVVPAAVGAYTIRPAPGSTGEHATLKAFVRANAPEVIA